MGAQASVVAARGAMLRAMATQRVVSSGTSLVSRGVRGEAYLSSTQLLCTRVAAVLFAVACVVVWVPRKQRTGWARVARAAGPMLLPALSFNLFDMLWTPVVTDNCRWPLLASLAWQLRVVFAAVRSGTLSPATPIRRSRRLCLGTSCHITSRHVTALR